MTFRDLLVRVALAPLPRDIRRRFGDDLRITATAAADDAWAQRGLPGLTAWTARELRDSARLAWREHRGTRGAGDRATMDGWTARGLAADLRHAGRLARRKPAFTVSIVGTLALTMAALTIVVAVATAVLWRPLPFAHEDRLVVLWESVVEDDHPATWRVTSRSFEAWRDAFPRTFDTMAAFAAASVTAIGQGHAVQLAGSRVTAGYFQVLGIRPLIGRTFTPDDETPGRERVIVLSEALWQARFGGRRDAIGQTIRLNDTPYEVIGVAPTALYPARPVTPATLVVDAGSQQFWIPIARTSAFVGNQRSHVYGVVARLAPGVSLVQAREHLRSVEHAPGTTGLGDGHAVAITSLRVQLTRDVRPMLLTIVAAIGVVLLICCANLASLYALHIDARARELAVRSAIGASDWRLGRQLLVEAAALTAAGVGLGIAIARWLLPALPAWLPDGVPLLTTLAIDWRVVTISGVVGLGIAALLAGWPVLRISRIRAASLRGVSAASPMRGHRWLVVGELSLALTLSVAAGLLGRSLLNVETQHPGFEVDRLLAFDVQLPAGRSRDPRVVAGFEQRMTERLRALPGVRAVAVAYDSPLDANWIDGFTFVEQDRDPVSDNQSAWLRIVSPSYFHTAGVPLRDGRIFGPADDLDRPGLIVVNRAFVAAFLRDRPALGTRLRSAAAQGAWGTDAPDTFTIVGIVENERFRGLEQPAAPAFYVSTAQFPLSGFTGLVRTTGDPRALASLMAGTVRAVDPEAPVSRVTTMRDALAEQFGNRRITTGLVVLFGAAAVLLAAIGLYGLLSMIVASRVREIGVRIALGAEPRRLARGVLAQALRHGGAGLAIGLPGAWLITRVLESLLVDVRRFDPLTIAAVAGLLLTVVALAAWRPARRAARIDPIQALRWDD